MKQTAVVVRPLQILRDFGAQKAARDRMLRIARDADGPAVFNRDQHRAGVGTVVRADGADDVGHWREYATGSAAFAWLLD